MTKDTVVEQIASLLKEAGEKQVEVNPEIESADKRVNELKGDLAEANKKLKKLEAFVETPRAGAKALAAQYLADGGHIVDLPDAIGKSTRTSFEYDDAEMVQYLIEHELYHLIIPQSSGMTAYLKQQGIKDDMPASRHVKTIINCDTDLTGLA